jgi:hypothetical protein
LLAAVMVAAPALASASSLLSGYGGPGQGNQAILGSALLNGPSGGGGSGGGSGSSGGGSGSSGGGAEGAGGSSTNTATSATGGETAAAGSAKGAPAGSGAASSGNSGTGSGAGGARGASGRSAGSAPRKAVAAASEYPASERLPASQQTGTLGLSTADLLYIILAAGTLAFVGVFTSRLTRTDAPGRHR